MDRMQRLDAIIAEARAAKSCSRRLDRLHDAQIGRLQTGAMSRGQNDDVQRQRLVGWRGGREIMNGDYAN